MLLCICWSATGYWELYFNKKLSRKQFILKCKTISRAVLHNQGSRAMLANPVYGGLFVLMALWTLEEVWQGLPCHQDRFSHTPDSRLELSNYVRTNQTWDYHTKISTKYTREGLQAKWCLYGMWQIPRFTRPKLNINLILFLINGWVGGCEAK